MVEIDAGSFRDPGGRVFTHAGRVFRAVFPANGRSHADALAAGQRTAGIVVQPGAKAGERLQLLELAVRQP